MDLMNALTSVLAGGATGLIGSVVTTGFNFFNQKQKNKHDLAVLEMESKILIEETKAEILVTEAKVTGEIQNTEAETFRDSVQQSAVKALSEKTLTSLAENKGTRWIAAFIALLLGILDFVKGMIRPSVTVYMLILITLFYLSAKEIVDKAGVEMSLTEAQALMQHIVFTVLYIATTIIFWWFGERGPARIASQQNNWKA